MRITQTSMLRDYGCSLTCVYEAACQRLWQISIRGVKSAKTAENAKFESLLVANLMELLGHAGGPVTPKAIMIILLTSCFLRCSLMQTHFRCADRQR